MNELIELDLTDLGLGLGLMAIAVGLSAWQQLGLETNLITATVRTIVQLIAVGYVLEIIFAINQPWVVLLILVVMLSIATVVARNQISRTQPRLIPIVGGSILLGTALTLGYVNLLIVQPVPWFNPQYLIPLTGIILGNAMNAAALAGERLISTLTNSQSEIETHLSLGATPEQATIAYRREAIKAGLIPTLNAMMVVGIVTLPGIMTGQLLSGVSPLNAAAYQMLILFALMSATLITTLLLIQLLYRQFFNQAAQLKVR